MEEKKAGRVIIIIAFCVVICLSNGIWFFVGKFLDSTNYENRQMATRPVLTIDNYGNFTSEYTSFFNDNLQFRNNLISLNAAIDYFCFGKSSSDHVIIGRKNWLFYSRTSDGDPVACYQGTNLFTEEELAMVAHNCEKQKEFLESQGKEFVIFIAPNKERVYSEYMPKRYGEPAENYRALQIYNYLKANTDVRVIFPYDELMEAKEKIKENIYYKTDTHWNYIGGYIGFSALAKELGITVPSLYGNNISIVAGDNTSGDLSGMLGLVKELKFADREYILDGYDFHNSECVENDYYGMWSFRAQNADPRNIYVIRDSFGRAMADYLGGQFDNTYLRHRNSYSYNDLAEHNPDIVVYEIVERYAGMLIDFSIR